MIRTWIFLFVFSFLAFTFRIALVYNVSTKTTFVYIWSYRFLIFSVFIRKGFPKMIRGRERFFLYAFFPFCFTVVVELSIVLECSPLTIAFIGNTPISTITAYKGVFFQDNIRSTNGDVIRYKYY